ncbi:MAG: energy-coupling factor transporter ATPase [Syntrophomonadaceae bacterium]|nr:energy-coupling factor transporter ATPase [Syntrophomonadaceae bacterium]
MIEIKGVSFSYPDGKSVLKDINLQIKPGEFLVLLGRNASGKSTLTKLLNGLLVPNDGDVLVDGLNTRDQNSLLSIRQRVGLLFSNPDNQLVASIVEEDVAFGPENLGLPAVEIRERVLASLVAVGMEKYREESLHRLSGGQKQRAAIAGVLALKPRYMVLDEPTAMLDPQGRSEVLKTLININQSEQTAIILVTHFPEEAVWADRVVIVGDGRIAWSGTPQEALTDPVRLNSFGLEVPEIVLLVKELKDMGYDLPPVLESSRLVELIQDYRAN